MKTIDLDHLQTLGYLHPVMLGPAGVCGIGKLTYTGALYIRIAADGCHGGRYCYETVQEAIQALQAWDGIGDPPGQWIKFKGGPGGERLGPGAGDRFDPRFFS